MDIELVKSFLMWCTILNVCFLLVSFLIWLLAADLVYKIHGKLFGISRETFNLVFYCFLGLYKVVVFALNLVPWLALEIVG